MVFIKSRNEIVFSNPNSLVIWRCQKEGSFKPGFELNFEDKEIERICLTADEKHLFVLYRNTKNRSKYVFIWDLTDNKTMDFELQLFDLNIGNYPISNFLVTPEYHVIVTAGPHVKIWQIHDLNDLVKYSYHSASLGYFHVKQIAVTPDSKQLLLSFVNTASGTSSGWIGSLIIDDEIYNFLIDSFKSFPIDRSYELSSFALLNKKDDIFCETMLVTRILKTDCLLPAAIINIIRDYDVCPVWAVNLDPTTGNVRVSLYDFMNDKNHHGIAIEMLLRGYKSKLIELNNHLIVYEKSDFLDSYKDHLVCVDKQLPVPTFIRSVGVSEKRVKPQVETKAVVKEKVSSPSIWKKIENLAVPHKPVKTSGKNQSAVAFFFKQAKEGLVALATPDKNIRI